MKLLMSPVALIMALWAAGAPAQPSGNDRSAPQAKQSQPTLASPLILASASDRVPEAVDNDPSLEPVPRPVPRVTKCRCGDPQAGDEQPAPAQPEK